MLTDGMIPEDAKMADAACCGHVPFRLTSLIRQLRESFLFGLFNESLRRRPTRTEYIEGRDCLNTSCYFSIITASLRLKLNPILYLYDTDSI
jgi:hypothetical protein